MSKVKIQGHASGTGVLTITAPNTSTDRTITLPDTTGTLLDENSSVPAANLTGTVADARISVLTASKLTGDLPAISGANLTGLTASEAGNAAFQARSNAGWSTKGNGTQLIFNGENFDTDSVYNTSTGYFVAPYTGVYYFYAAIYVGWSDSTHGYYFAKNGSVTDVHGYGNQYGVYHQQSDSSDMMISMQTVINLTANDTITIKAGTQSDFFGEASYWGGFRLK